MSSSNFSKAGLLAVFLLLSFLIGWELFLRHKQLKPSYDDNEALWSDKRARVYLPSDKATVFIGSSRIKYDLDIDTWQKQTGLQAVQLAMVGSTPLPVLEDLSNDPKFRGNLVIDVTEFLYFSTSPRNTQQPIKNIAYYKKRTPTQRASFAINKVLEAGFVFLDEENFSTNALLNRLPLHNRPGVMTPPVCPRDFGRVTFERQNKMTDRFLSDSNLKKQVTDLWVLYGKMTKEPPASGAKLDSLIKLTQTAVAKIQHRGGHVVFVRTPSSGPLLQRELGGFPKNKYWDRLLAATGCDGIYYKDYPELAHFICPEWSHLSPKDAVSFTKSFIQISRQKGWFTTPAAALLK